MSSIEFKNQESPIVSVPFLDLKAQYREISEELHLALNRVIESQNFILGPEVVALESEVASYCRCKYGIGVSSGSDALIISLMAIGINPGDEVITTAYTFFATAGAIARLGATPVFVDIEPSTYNIDPSKIEEVITARTKAIIPAHLFGQTADMDPIMQLANRQRLFVIEDAAQAIGAEYHGRRAGSIGHLGCFSFFPSKNLGAYGDGGMVTTNDDLLAERVRLLRNHGQEPKYFNKLVGGNFRLDAIQAAVLRVKLKYLDGWIEARKRHVERYQQLFREEVPDFRVNGDSTDYAQRIPYKISPPLEIPDSRHVYNQFVVRAALRDELRKYLSSKGIGTQVYYPVPLHLQECFKNLGGKVGDFPISESASEHSLALPIYPELKEEMLHTVVRTVAEFFTNTE